MSHFAAHGYYRISWHGDVIKVIVGDLFNREGVEQLVAEIDQAVAQGARTGWGLLLDARQWQGGTPEAFELWLTRLEGWIRAGELRAYSALYAESIQVFLGGTIRDRLTPLFPYFSSPDEAACWQWLGSQGLAVGTAG